MADMSDVKPGDTVFVVQQMGRHQTSPRAVSEGRVAKVGRKYAYLECRYRDEPFELATGNSHHASDCNARANGFGFDVYHSREEYEREQHDHAEYIRLKERLVNGWRGFVALSPEVVQAIHGVLDGEGEADG